jgi:DNA repair photolyase
MNGPHGGLLQTRSWPGGAGRPVEYVTLKVRSLLRQSAEAHGPWHWTVNPYEGCQFGCTFCHARLDRKEVGEWLAFERRIRVKANAVEAFHRDIRASDFENRQVVLGTQSEAWQQAEEHFRVTRALLEAMTKVDGVDLRVNTRSSLIARDTDLLRKIAERGKVTIAFSLASVDERINRVMEPGAPSAFRRLAALEALARAGISVGLVVSPLFAGLDEEELGLESLLTRAANAGARFAGAEVMHFGPGQRENFLANVTQVYPDLATRFRRIIGRRPLTQEERQARLDTFLTLCQRFGLAPLEHALAPKERAPEQQRSQQLSLFGAEALV